jgi:hypothetical protein
VYSDFFGFDPPIFPNDSGRIRKNQRKFIGIRPQKKKKPRREDLSVGDYPKLGSNGEMAMHTHELDRVNRFMAAKFHPYQHLLSLGMGADRFGGTDRAHGKLLSLCI